MHETNHVTLSFTCDLDERAEWEIEQKGWFEHALVHLPDGSSVQVQFWDPVRLAQDLETDSKSGKTCIAEPGMIVIPKVTVAKMRAAVEELYHNRYFDRLKSAFE
jgi:hypothetical protein